jgi:hypothetical protein
MTPGDVFDPSERREEPRADVSTAAVVLVRHNEGAAMTIESVSTSGARLVGPVTLDVGERIQILFEVDGSPIEVSGEVVRVEATDMTTDRIAVRFVDVADDTRVKLRLLVQRALEHEDEQRQADVDDA